MAVPAIVKPNRRNGQYIAAADQFFSSNNVKSCAVLLARTLDYPAPFG